MKDNYLRAMKADSALARQYFSKSIVKTQQQEALESLLLDSISRGELEQNAPYTIADLACGGGTLSYHLASFFPNARFVLLDYNDEALSLAREINAPFIKRMRFVEGDLRALPLDSGAFDMVFCWQSLGWVEREDIEGILKEMIRILREGGRVYASSLFNTEFDVDLYTTICDRTRPSSINHANPKAPLNNGNYNTYCLQTLRDMCGELVRVLEVVPFYASGDLERDLTQRGIGSFTYRIDSMEKNAPMAGNSSLGAGHSALSDKSAILRSDFRLRTSVVRPQSSLESPDFSSQSEASLENKPCAVSLEILECQAESSPTDSYAKSESSYKDSQGVSESTASDSRSLQTLESKADSKRASAVGHSSTAIKSIGAESEARSDSLSRPLRGAENRKKGGATASADLELEAEKRGTLPICRKEKAEALFFSGLGRAGRGEYPFSFCDKATEEVLESREAKVGDSERLDSESEILKIQEAKTKDSKAMDSESQIPYNTGAGYHPQHNTTQHNTTQHNTTQHNTTQHTSAPNHIRRYATQLGDTPPHQVSARLALPHRSLSRHTISHHSCRTHPLWRGLSAHRTHLTHEQNAHAKEAV